MKEARPLIIQKFFSTPGHEQQKKPGHFLLVQIIYFMKNKQIANIFDCQQIFMNPPSHVHKVSHFFLLALKVFLRFFFLHPISTPQTTQTTNSPQTDTTNWTLKMVHTWHEISTVAAPLRCRQVDPSMAWFVHGVTRALKERVPF